MDIEELAASMSPRATGGEAEELRSDAAQGGLADDAELLHRLRGAPITGIARVVYSSNAVFLLQLEGADPRRTDEPLRAIYKPARGERPLWDFPRRTLHLRERATYLVSAALADGLVPPTVLRDGPHGPGSVQQFVHVVDRPLTDAEATHIEEQLHVLAALDVLINNADRKRAHLLVTERGLQAIDNALSFLPYPRQRTVLMDLGGEALPHAAVAPIRRLAADADRRLALRHSLERLLHRAEVEAFFHRLDELVTDPVYPRLDPWDGRPFEWW